MSDAAADLSGNAPPPPPPEGGTPPPSPSGNAPPPPAPAWTDSLDDDGKKFVETKGYKSPAEALAALREHAPPETPDAYNLGSREGADPEFIKVAQGKFHELGLTLKQVEGLANWSNEQEQAAAAAAARAETDAQAKIDREAAALKTELGESHTRQMELARRAFTQYVPGATPEAKAALAKVLQREVGYGATMKMFAAIGAHLAEDTAHGMGNPNAAPTVAAAARLYDKSNMNP